MDPDSEMTVTVFVHPQLSHDAHLDTQLLLEFPPQTSLQALPPLALASRKLPEPSQ
jgi:hypothetical protein